MNGALREAEPGEIAEKREVLWDVVEEHLAESEFLVERLERACDSPTLTLKSLEKGLEARLLAHLDALILGGAPVYERLLEPLLDEPDPDGPAVLTAAGLVAVESGRAADLGPALGHDAPEVRAAAVNACSLAGGPRFDDWVRARLGDVTKAEERASLLSIAARRGLEPPPLVEWLQGDRPYLVRAAAEAARYADPRRHLAVIEYLLEHDDAGVREAAMIVGLAWGSRRASVVCENLALAVDAPRPLSMAIYAALAGPAQHERLAQKLADPRHRRATLFALGFCGSAAQLPTLLGHLSSPDPTAAKIAAQAISTIVGVDLTDDAFVAKPSTPAPPARDVPAAQDPEAQRSLPSLEEDDLDADLVPAPEDDLPTPDVAAIRRFCELASSKLASGQRYLHGKPLSAGAIVHSLEHAPLRLRHVLALLLGIKTSGKTWIDTRTWSRIQRRQLGAGAGGREP